MIVILKPSTQKYLSKVGVCFLRPFLSNPHQKNGPQVAFVSSPCSLESGSRISAGFSQGAPLGFGHSGDEEHPN